MASADYASLADNLTREIGVMIVTSPEIRSQIGDIRAAAECFAEAAAESGLLDDLTDVAGDLGVDIPDIDLDAVTDVLDVVESVSGSEAGEDGFISFQADIDQEAAIEAARAASEALAGCTNGIDKWAIGNLAGELFTKFFNNELKALV